MKSSSDLIDATSRKVVSLSYDDPQIKLDLAVAVMQEFARAGMQVQYIDFDLQLSSMLENLSKEKRESLSSLEVFPQLTGEISDLFLPFESSREGGVIAIDTINTLQNLLLAGDLKDSSTANHRTAIIITLLEEVAKNFSKTLLMLNLTRSRPRKTSETIQWDRDIVGGRMTRFKSDVILYARESNKTPSGILSVEVVSPDRKSEVYEIQSFLM